MNNDRKSEESKPAADPFPTEEAFQNLAERLRSVHQERCRRGLCQCVTKEDHERSLGLRR